MEVTHQDLISRCLQHDRRAQTEIYRLYSRAMFNVAFRIVKDMHYAEDVMQESFLKAFTRIRDYRQEVAFGAWLKRIVVNASIDFCKKQKKIGMQDFEEVLVKVEDEPMADNSDFSRLRADEVLKTMNTIKPSYQLILTLHFIEGYDQEEITQILGITPVNCRTTLSRAKESLRKKLKER